jgi:hypothetical protein
VGPQPAVVGGAAALSGDAGGLAGDAASDAMNAATPRAAVEGAEVAPNRSVIQQCLLHAPDQERGDMGFPFHITNAPGGRLGELEAEVEAAGPAAQGEDVEGTYSHMHTPRKRRRG